MNKETFQKDRKLCRPLRYGMFIPIVLMLASVVSGYMSYNDARQSIADDLNEAVYALVRDNSELWTRQDTIAALRKMNETTHKPLIYPADDVVFRHEILRKDAYFMLALVDGASVPEGMQGHRMLSDSIMLVPEHDTDGIAIQVQGFANCSMASVFSASDQTIPGVLLAFSILSTLWMFWWHRRPENELLTALAAIRLTPMQRQFTQMLLDAPGHKVDKAILCAALWGNKINAEESLYTLVRRTKAALADTGIEIVCNRGDSYELRIEIK